MMNRMQRSLRALAPFGRGLLLVAAGLLALTPAEAKKKVAAVYDLSGSVLFHDHDGQVYRFATDRLIFTLTCDKVRKVQFHDPQCMVNGRPIVVGNTVRFRIDGDQAYLPPVKGATEQELQILFTELKTPPAISPSPVDGVARGVVLGAGQTFWARPQTRIGNAAGYGRPVWTCETHILTGGKVYQLDCTSNPCQVNDDDVEPGATYAIRLENKTAWLSMDGVHFNKDDKFKVLGVSDYPPPQAVAPATR